MAADGWHQDLQSLRPVLDDEAEFRAVHADDPALDALVALFAGRAASAEVLLRRQLSDGVPDVRLSRRLHALLADARRDQGFTAEAAATYRSLIDTEMDPLRRATFVQHLGKTHFAAGDFEQAEACFAAALGERVDGGAAAELVESSAMAVAAARRRRTRGHGESGGDGSRSVRASPGAEQRSGGRLVRD